MSGADEFLSISELFAPLAASVPEALGLSDDAAVIPSRPGFDLVVTKDAMVEGVHFLPDDPLDLVAGKLLRANLSDLAAKGAEPYGYFIACAWSERCGWSEREAFAQGLARDQAAFGIGLMGGDTTATPGPLTLSLTAMGWVPAGRMVCRSGARAGDTLLVSGTIGDGWLGLQAVLGRIDDATGVLAGRYRSPRPRLDLRAALRAHAAAAADVSDGLLADAGHLGEASGCAVVVELDRLPLSSAAGAWLGRQADPRRAMTELATGGDDYEVVCAARPEAAEALTAAGFTAIGRLVAGQGVSATFRGEVIALDRTGYRHI